MIAVGDSCQQIYEWRGAEDYLKKVESQAEHQIQLATSYRFNPEIASIANGVLKYLTKSSLIGMASSFEEEFDIRKHNITYIQRTNNGCFLRALSLIHQNRPFKINIGACCVLQKYILGPININV